MAGKKEDKNKARRPDLISALPDGIRERVLSFLPAHEAVRTCVLARSWRDVWKRSPALHITEWGTVNNFTDFVYNLLSHRAAPLVSCHFDLSRPCFEQECEDENIKESVGCVFEALEDSWIKEALEWKVQVLRAALWFKPGETRYENHNPWLFHCPVSENLKELDLSHACFHKDTSFRKDTDSSVVDFSGCPALLKLRMKACEISADQIRSLSLEHLAMVRCVFRDRECTVLRLPSLVTLELTDCLGRKPLLEASPSLITAVVRMDHCCYDGFWRNKGFDEPECKCSFDALFHTLSNVKRMELSACPELFDFNRDIMPCPEFSKLKTLVLTDWFVADGLSALTWFLQNSPILERITLELSAEAKKSSEGTERSYTSSKESVASKHLKMVEIRCEADHRMILVMKILRILNAFGVPLEIIGIQCSEKGYDCFGFACTGFSSICRGQRKQNV